MTDVAPNLGSRQPLVVGPQARGGTRRGVGQAGQGPVRPQETEEELAARVYAEVRRSLKIALLVAALGAVLSMILR